MPSEVLLRGPSLLSRHETFGDRNQLFDDLSGAKLYRDWTDTAEQVGTVKDGDPVFAIDAVLIVSQPGKVTVTADFTTPVGLKLRAQKKVYTLHYVGEGCEFAWYEEMPSRLIDFCPGLWEGAGFQQESERKARRALYVKTGSGESAWLRDDEIRARRESSAASQIREQRKAAAAVEPQRVEAARQGQEAPRQAVAHQENQRQDQAERDAAKVCRSAASQVARQERAQPTASVAPATRLTEAEATRLIREKLGFPGLWSVELNGIGKTDPLYGEVFCLVSEGYVKPRTSIYFASVVAEKGKNLIEDLFWGTPYVDFKPYTHRADVKRIDSILTDSNTNTATVTYELVVSPTEYFERLRQIDPKSVDKAARSLAFLVGENKRVMRFRKWDQGWLPD